MAERPVTFTRRCAVNPLIGREIEGMEILPARQSKKVMVVGAGVICKDKDGNEVLVPGKTVICALGQRANRADVDALRGCAPFVREVGDCVRPANITKAIYEAYHAALDI